MPAESFLLEAGNAVTVTANAASSGSVLRLPDSAGETQTYSPTALPASSSLVIGPFATPRRYRVTSDTGALTWTAGVADATATSAGLASAMSDETGTGSAVFATSPTLVTPVIGVATGTSLAVTAGLTSSGGTGAGIGYATGAGGAVTQITNRTTGVTLNKLTGAITTHTASLAAATAAEFVVTNSTVAIGDVVLLSIRSGTSATRTAVVVAAVTNGTFNIRVVNNGTAAVSPDETGAIIINFAVIKAVAA